MSNNHFLVGDAGGTSTQWRFMNNGSIEQFLTIGFNAYTHNVGDFKESVTQTLGSIIEHGVQVYLYAAGVDTFEQKKEAEDALSSIFGDNVAVENDLVGAARGLCGANKGNVCIMGTGSNACYYDGQNVDKVSASLGYVLGDEGSGAYMGKKLLMRVFRNQIDQSIIQEFNEEFDLDSHKVINQIYNQPRPNHFLASFAPFILERKGHPEVYQLVSEAFKDFFHAFFYRQKHLEEPFHFSGSIAYHFSDILRQVGSDLNYNIQNIVESPISGLVLYHKEHG